MRHRCFARDSRRSTPCETRQRRRVTLSLCSVSAVGHLAVQYARHMGFEVAAISRGSDTAQLAKKLGAHHYIDSAATDPAAALQALGGAKVIVVTASGGKTIAETFKGLRPGGVSIDLGVGPEPI